MSGNGSSNGFQICDIDVSAYTVPTDQPEADGTLSWDSTTAVVVRTHVRGGVSGLGYTYTHHSAATLISDLLAPTVIGRDVRDVPGSWAAMRAAVRNYGSRGLCSAAIAAVDIALWDAKARCTGQPLHRLLGAARQSVPVYASGGFLTYSEDELVDQMGSWAADGFGAVKMKIGRDWREDLTRISAVRAELGDKVELFVDANGGYSRSRAATTGRVLADEAGVTWFEEPVSSDDTAGLGMLSAQLPLDIAAGEYGSQLEDYPPLLSTVDVVQADVTRCAGITEWLRIAAAAQAAQIPISGHCAQSVHVHAATVPPNLRHLEYFHDHARVERLLFSGVLDPVHGHLEPIDTPGHGLMLKEQDAEPYRVG